ncbi:hypothetical protein [Loigolactobacillus coryniformis]|nr:hypothetical protein [Loigolactobacillus coryniformis]MCL5458536.1 hypothetical protein [Loigolactobacillus coryniformis]
MDKQATLAAITQGFVRSQSLLLALGDENRQLLIMPYCGLAVMARGSGH